jgi:hypothetical protein
MAIQEFTIEELHSEIWEDVVGYEGIYSVSNLGRVRRDLGGRCNAIAGRILRPALDKSGYWFVGLCGREKHMNLKIHSIVAAAFIGKRPRGLVINHKDGCKLNNRPENLEYCTASENTLHAYSHGFITHVRGENNGSAKLKDAEVIEIFLFRAAGWKPRETAARFNVSTAQVQRILNGQSRSLSTA